MKYSWLDGYCLAKLGATKEFKEEWNATRSEIFFAGNTKILFPVTI